MAVDIMTRDGVGQIAILHHSVTSIIAMVVRVDLSDIRRDKVASRGELRVGGLSV